MYEFIIFILLRHPIVHRIYAIFDTAFYLYNIIYDVLELRYRINYEIIELRYLRLYANMRYVSF